LGDYLNLTIRTNNCVICFEQMAETEQLADRPEEGAQTPEDTIFEFQRANYAIVATVRKVIAEPSRGGLEELDSLAAAGLEISQIFYKKDYFRKTRDVSTISAAMGAMTNGLFELAHCIKSIDPDSDAWAEIGSPREYRKKTSDHNIT
jgi:hypothetical protein